MQKIKHFFIGFLILGLIFPVFFTMGELGFFSRQPKVEILNDAKLQATVEGKTIENIIDNKGELDIIPTNIGAKVTNTGNINFTASGTLDKEITGVGGTINIVKNTSLQAIDGVKLDTQQIINNGNLDVKVKTLTANA